MADQLALTALLKELGQEHIFDGWPPPGEASADKERFFDQVAQLDASYPGGLRAYVTNGRKLLADSKSGVNPLDGWIPSVPTGTSLEFASPVYTEHEAIGESEIGGCGFVLVAGGLGERLGFSGIKVALPYQITTEEPYLKLYISSILALQQRATELTGKEVELPLAIMVSEDTAAGTEELLKTNGFFGMKASQVTLLKQEKVPCLSDNEARLSIDPKDPFRLLTKPHGHGDVHFLMHSSGTIEKWEQAGVRWVYFFQDTNAPAFKVLPASLGVSKKLDLEVNSVSIARKAGESVGAIMTLTNQDGHSMTVNVEYNQIDALLKATVDPRGDVNGENGYSAYPGSINQLIFALPPYAAKLKETGGSMPEFVNPKYTDSSKTAFKSPTRLECMMQDYPKSLSSGARVGFSVVTGTIAFSPVKTNLADAKLKLGSGMPTYSAPSGEADIYAGHCQMLSALGVQVDVDRLVVRAGVEVIDCPRVVIDPSFGVTLDEWRSKLPSPSNIKLAPGSTLVLSGDLRKLRIESLNLKGTLVVSLAPGAEVTLKNVNEDNAGWRFCEIAEGDQVPEPLAIRGYTLEKNGQRVLDFPKPGTFTVDDPAN
ncbi:hypothetical protein AB1Y20_004772 [Prymnesium parvum]|uniref:UTP-monosaccharide-1-phosphate uridylyltransferase n=1 Tax=Prymnesium parvum TaxID=97485 RepID=A0AB34IZT6_PRYPA